VGIWLKNGQDVLGQPISVLVDQGVIQSIVTSAKLSAMELAGHEVIDVKSRLISPGLIDMHVHFREPGFEYKEDIETGSQAAIRGGYTTVACMPNTRPVMDQPQLIKQVIGRAESVGLIRVLPYGCITFGELGRELTHFAALKEAGAIGFTDDGVGVQNASVMKEAMQLAKTLNMPIIAHCEEDTLVTGAAVTDGAFARRHGLKGIPNESEAIHVGRDILLAEATGVHYHVCHVSTEQSVRLIRLGKSAGVHVTAEVCPHHLLLSDEDIPDSLDANWKMNPPLRTPRDVTAMIQALEDGTIDMIVTDHAPHSVEEKARGLERAPFGIVGLETAFPLLYTHFVTSGRWSLAFLVDKMTARPAQVFGLPQGKLTIGSPADLTVIDLNQERIIEPASFASKGRNTPFAGWKCKGWPVLTMFAGKVVWSENGIKESGEIVG
jgi:dihydroorotase